MCAFIVFKAESKPKHEENKFWGGFLQKPKTHFFGGTFKKSSLKFVFLRLFFNAKGSSMPIFIKKYKYLGPLEFFENENFDACAACAENLDLDF